MTIAILGGTFNPIHMGHLQLAEEVRLKFGYDRIIFVPNHLPAHKTIEGSVKPARRLAMLRLAVRGIPCLAVDPCELKRGGISYSIDTIRDLKRRYRLSVKPGLIIGDDLASGFDAWREASALAEEADIILANRGSAPGIPFAYPHRRLENLLFPISSHEIRRRLSVGAAVLGFLPKSVYLYIAKHGLYGA